MSIISSLSKTGDIVSIVIQGRFDFGSHQAFQKVSPC